jgi:hypothetical protein
VWRWLVSIAWAVAVGVASVLVMMRWGNRRRAKALPDVSDREFLRMYHERFAPGDEAVVLRERNYIARLLGVPTPKLTPAQAFSELERYSSLSYHVALGDLASDIDAAYRKAGLKSPSVFPPTVGEAIDALREVRAAAHVS